MNNNKNQKKVVQKNKCTKEKKKVYDFGCSALMYLQDVHDRNRSRSYITVSNKTRAQVSIYNVYIYLQRIFQEPGRMEFC